MTAHCHMTPSWNGVCGCVGAELKRSCVYEEFERFISPLVWFTLLTVSIPAYSLSVQHSYLTQLSTQGHTSTQNRHLLSSGPNLWKKKNWTVWKSGDLFLPNRYRTASWAQSDIFRWLLLSSQLSNPPPKKSHTYPYIIYLQPIPALLS